MIRAGELNQRIEIHGTVRTTDPRWGVSTTETMTTMAWAKVKQLKAEERLVNGQVQTDLTHVVTIRHNPDVNEMCNIRWRGRTLEIVGIVTDDRRTEMQISCREQPVAGVTP